MYSHNTYDRRIQLGASRQRWKDAETLHNAGRWTGAMYMAGYAIECALCASICFHEDKNNFKDTKVFLDKGIQGAMMHSLMNLLQELPKLQKLIMDGNNGQHKGAWNTITSFWQKDKLRYWDKLGNKSNSERFIEAVRVIHRIILNYQGEAS